MSNGVIYIATGQEHLQEACQSAASLKAVMPQLPVTLFSDQSPAASCFDQVIIVEKPSYSFFDKVQYMYRSPYDRTLFLDTDTYICADFSEIFDLLDRFDVAASHAPLRIFVPKINDWITYTMEGVPDSFPEMNSGVILFRKSAKVEAFFSFWYDLYVKQMDKEEKPLPDQPAFREALYKSDIRVATLTPEYNCRFIAPFFVSKTVKILHGHAPNLAQVAKEINAKDCARVFIKWDSFQECELVQAWQQYELEIEGLRHQVVKLDHQLTLMKNSRAWKLRNWLASFKHLFRA